MRATHEAGHAVAALALGVGVKLATILTDDGIGGHVDLIDSEDARLAERAMVYLAGREAVSLAGLLDDDAQRGCRGDLERVRALVLPLADGDATAAERLTVELSVRVRDLLSEWEHASAVGRVSIELLQRWTLTGAEVSEIVTAEAERVAAKRTERIQ